MVDGNYDYKYHKRIRIVHSFLFWKLQNSEKSNMKSNTNQDIIGLDEYDSKFDDNLSKNSIIMLGLENVGKSSVVMKYFERNKSIDDIKNIKPTIYQNIIQKQNLFFGINRYFRFFYLG